LPITE